jgi:hypothetical protein
MRIVGGFCRKQRSPATCARRPRSSWITPSTETLRTERGTSLMKSVPVFTPTALAPRAPTLDMKDSTRGSAATMAAACCCIATMAGKDTPSGPSVCTKMRPASSLGRKPLGMALNMSTVPTSTPAENSSVSRGCRSTRRRLRSYPPRSPSSARSLAA